MARVFSPVRPRSVALFADTAECPSGSEQGVRFALAAADQARSSHARQLVGAELADGVLRLVQREGWRLA